MRITTLLIMSLCLLTACTNAYDEQRDLPENPQNPDSKDSVDSEPSLKLYLKSDKKAANMFESIQFTLTDKQVKQQLFITKLKEMCQNYDSIVWRVPASKGSRKLFYWERGDGSFHSSISSGWAHSFYYPGKAKCILSAYKDGEILYGDTLEVDVKNDKDFLMYNWADIKDNSDKISTGHVNSVNENFTLYSYTGVNDVPYINVFIENSLNRDDEEMRLHEKELLNYISNIYGKPLYDSNSPGLTEFFKTNFKAVKAEYMKPVSVWQTEKNNIALLSGTDTEEEMSWTYIHAEPRQGR